MTAYLLCYDVATGDGDSRLRAVARTCEGYGRRVQKSVFELHLGEAHLPPLIAELRAIIDPDKDSIRIYVYQGSPAHSLGRSSVFEPGDATHW